MCFTYQYLSLLFILQKRFFDVNSVLLFTFLTISDTKLRKLILFYKFP